MSTYIVKIKREITTLIEVEAKTAKAAIDEIKTYGVDLAAVDYAKQDDDVKSYIVGASIKND